jgi:hypothetical protein
VNGRVLLFGLCNLAFLRDYIPAVWPFLLAGIVRFEQPHPSTSRLRLGLLWSSSPLQLFGSNGSERRCSIRALENETARPVRRPGLQHEGESIRFSTPRMPGAFPMNQTHEIG